MDLRRRLQRWLRAALRRRDARAQRRGGGDCNYRLGVFGFLAHPDLAKESPHHTSGNYAMMDMQAALRWVQKNIESFGGDPQRVTIDGEPAGAIMVGHGGFARRQGAVQACGCAERRMDGHINRAHDDARQAEAAGVKLAQGLNASAIADLRTKSADDLVKARGNVSIVVDGCSCRRISLPRSRRRRRMMWIFSLGRITMRAPFRAAI